METHPDIGPVTDLFYRALDLPPEERDSFLDEACNNDQALRKQVEKLLQADQDAGSFLEAPVFSTSETPTSDGKPASRLLSLFLGKNKKPLLDIEALESGTVLAERYRILERIGRGGMGEVYRAADLKIKQTVALKGLYQPLQESARTVRRFFDEVRLARQITHPNVCRVYDIEEANGRYFISMEYIDGQNLNHWLSRTDNIDLARTTTIARQLCQGLAAAHQVGILHRDLKPANLMIDRHGNLKVTDFGLAVSDVQITGIEARNGTPAYMAPEQRAGREATVKSDIYALGLVLKELFTGEPPSEQSRPGESHPRKLRHALEELPQRTTAIIQQCLSEDPGQRPESVAQVARALANEADVVVRPLVICRQLLATQDQGVPTEFSDRSPLGEAITRFRGRQVEIGPLRQARKWPEATAVLFHQLADGVEFALAVQEQYASAEPAPTEHCCRIGIHLVEIEAEHLDDEKTSLEPSLFDPQDLDTTMTLAMVAEDRQILITRGAFDLARSRTFENATEVRWQAHGSYEIRGRTEPLEICEVGRADIAPLRRPRSSERIRPQIAQPALTGWRPAPGLALPERDDWIMERKTGDGGFGEVWLARHRETHEARVFKFCYDSASLRSLQREITLFKLLKETLGERDDISRLLSWNFDRSPYYIEAEFTDGGSLDQWVVEQGGFDQIPMEVRLEIVAQVGVALAAAHSVGVLHKDVKPGNILITLVDGRPQARLSDFGLGFLTERDRLAQAGVTALGFTDLPNPSSQGSSPGGTRLYMAPELLEGKPATLQSDLYALGILLYQMVAGDLSRALAPGWERDIKEPLLVDDISLAVDGRVDRRLDSGLRLAERLRQLEERQIRRRTWRQHQLNVKKAQASLVKVRRRWRLALAAVAVLALFATTVLFQSQRLSEQVETNQKSFELFDQILSLLNPMKDSEARLSPVLAIQTLIARAEDTFADQPEAQARLFLRFANVIGTYDEGLSAKELLTKALELSSSHGLPQSLRAEILHNRAEIFRSLGELDMAEQDISQAIALLGSTTLNPFELAKSLTLRGYIYHHQAKRSEAETDFLESLQLSQGLDSLTTETRSLIAETKMRLGVLLQGGFFKRFDDARKLLIEALEIQKSISGENSGNYAFCLNSLAENSEARGLPEEAEAMYRRVLAIRQEIFPEPHSEVSHSYRALGVFYMRQGEMEQSKTHLDWALNGYHLTLGENHPYRAVLLQDLAEWNEKRSQTKEARDLLEEALALRTAAYGPGHRITVETQTRLNKLLQTYPELQEFDALEGQQATLPVRSDSQVQ